MKPIVDILILGNTDTHPARNVKLKKFLQVLSQFCTKPILISGTCPLEYRENLHWIKVQNIFKSRSSLLYRIVGYVLTQIKLSVFISILSVKYKYNIIFNLLPHPLILFTAKVFGKRVLQYQAGFSLRQHQKNNTGFISFVSGIIEKISTLLADRIIVQSRSCIKFQDLLRYQTKINFVSFHVDLELFTYDLDFEKRKNIVAYIGNLTASKGVKELMSAVEIILNQKTKADLKFVIGGVGPLLNKIIQRIRKRDLGDFVNVVGWIPHEKLPQYLNSFKLLVLPSYSEGIPSIVLEAMACGVPVLATPVGGIPDVIKHNENGFLLKNNSPKYIADTILDVLDRKDLYVISQAAKMTIESKFNFKSAVANFLEIIKSLGLNSCTGMMIPSR